MNDVEALAVLQTATEALRSALSHPHGLEVAGDEKVVAGNACVALCGGDRAKAISLWKLIAQDLGYMPRAAAVALIRASNTNNLVPDVTAPEPS